MKPFTSYDQESQFQFSSASIDNSEEVKNRSINQKPYERVHKMK
jgi:hypothetical protein